jgi:hypothetical protein
MALFYLQKKLVISNAAKLYSILQNNLSNASNKTTIFSMTYKFLSPTLSLFLYFSANNILHIKFFNVNIFRILGRIICHLATVY